tara:strand:- start:113 stop:481 length:369 start_codon:yes stop_codon:yes gene_type:complete
MKKELEKLSSILELSGDKDIASKIQMMAKKLAGKDFGMEHEEHTSSEELMTESDRAQMDYEEGLSESAEENARELARIIAMGFPSVELSMDELEEKRLEVRRYLEESNPEFVDAILDILHGE